MDTRKLKRTGPILAAALALCVVGVLGIGDTTVIPPTEAYFTEIRESVDDLPYSIDRWIGQDEAVTPSARELLRPNVIIQRRYVDPENGDAFSLLVVHCGNTKDMQGHYPPVCYPAHGWAPVESERTTMESGGVEYPVMRYRFSQNSQIRSQEIVVVNFFVLPGVVDPISPTINRLERLSHTAGTSALGSAQVQVLFARSSSESYRREVFGHIVEALQPMMREIASVPK